MIDFDNLQVTLAEVKKAKEKAESKVSDILNNLETKYGVKVSYVNFYNNKLDIHLALEFA